MADKEKRSAPREAVHFVAEIDLDGQRVGCAVSRDASGAGLLLLTRVDPDVGSRLILHLYVPGETDARVLETTVVRSEAIALTERVLWSYRVAVKFDQPRADMQEIIESLTRLRSKGPAAPDQE